MGCAVEYNTCITRGDIWALDVGLGPEWTEVEADPAGYIGKLVLREEQDDALPIDLELTAVPQIVVNPTPNSVKVYMEFTATSAMTQQLPWYDLVGYVEIAPLSDPAQSRRLFNMEVEVSD